MNESTDQTVFGATAVVAGLGVLILALFPLALPCLILVAVALLPLAPLAVVGGLIAVPVLAARALRARRTPPARSTGRDWGTERAGSDRGQRLRREGRLGLLEQ